ncbi:hypothetical protein NDU88_003670 [Pleurodeles waltl]|uniref:Uncharacterized protein n=1 Tax=Pleurodeles waltl TaxID=8319 RepID=A0AAV7RIW3_PLEWA|nr:hypothetical protein NDU88_003670 [Pleurodeles waltl]
MRPELRYAVLNIAVPIVLPLASRLRDNEAQKPPPRSTYFLVNPTMPDDLLESMLLGTRESVFSEGHKKGEEVTNREKGLKWKMWKGGQYRVGHF